MPPSSDHIDAYWPIGEREAVTVQCDTGGTSFPFKGGAYRLLRNTSSWRFVPHTALAAGRPSPVRKPTFLERATILM